MARLLRRRPYVVARRILSPLFLKNGRLIAGFCKLWTGNVFAANGRGRRGTISFDIHSLAGRTAPSRRTCKGSFHDNGQ